MSRRISPLTVLFGIVAIVVVAGVIYSLLPARVAGETVIKGNGKNALGQLANYSTGGTSSMIDIPEKVSQVAAGFDHSLALTENGTVYAWGDNTYGQVGIGSAKGIVSGPQKIEGLPPIAEIGAGFRHSLALDREGRVWVWGNNIAGQLGTGDRVDLRKPTKIGLPGQAFSIAAGHRFSLATLDNGKVYGWGAKCEKDTKRSFAELMRLIGQSATGISYYVDANADPSSSDTQEICEFQGFVAVSSLTPIEIPELAGSTQIVAGFGHVLALQADGTVKSKGCNAYGQLGYPTADIVPAETIPGLKGIVAIAASTRHSMALDRDGKVWAWGADNTGQLGKNLGNLEGVFEPEAVAGLPKITSIAAGHDFSLGLDEEGRVWAWGANKNEQTPGIETTAYNSTPKLTSLSNETHIAAGGAFTLAY
ncbi:RCC1 domain-containing protein [Cohnella suwonensis]|uniref:RCC1 domain-containing protein n=1 Tax=Cohnella suwonensis TaxID=696072 RepID=A0ABW0LQU6_9BACL